MLSVPAPADAQELREYLMSNQIDVDHLYFHLNSYLLGLPAPSDDVFADPVIALQQYTYQDTLRTFCEMIYRKPDPADANGEEPEAIEPEIVLV